MNGKLARQLVNDYVGGWVNGDALRIISSLSKDCVIVESHGPTYYGIGQVEKWIDEWCQNGKVDKWSIDSFFFAHNTAFFEWSFTCTIDGKTGLIDGASVVQLKNKKIYHIHEYRMSKPAFDYFES